MLYLCLLLLNLYEIKQKNALHTFNNQNKNLKNPTVRNPLIRYPIKGKCGNNVRYCIYSNGSTIILGRGEISNFTSKSSPFFVYRHIIKYITIGDEITSVGRFAFCNCSKLEEVSFGLKVDRIYEYAFINCPRIKHIISQNKNSLKCSTTSFSFIYKNQSELFSEANRPNELHLCNNFINFSNEHFPHTHLTKFKPFSNERNKYSSTINNDISNVNKPKNKNHIHRTQSKSIRNRIIKQLSGECGENVSYTIDALTHVVEISGTGPMANFWHFNSPFSRYSRDIDIVIINSGVTTIGNCAFVNCWLKNITIPDTVTTIGDEAFYRCINLSSLDLPNGITTIGDGAFSSTSLIEIFLPATVRVIADEAFTFCKALTKFVVDSNNAYFASIGGVLFDKNIRTLIQYPIGLISSNYTIPDSVTAIGNSSFYDALHLTSVLITDNVITIGNRAFQDCQFLRNVTMGNSVTLIGRFCFIECVQLRNFIISSNVVTIEQFAFYLCSNLTNFTIPNSVTTLGSHAFSCCTSLANLTISNGLTKIAYDTFSYCYSLTTVIIPNSINEIGSQAFLCCTNLNNITIPYSVHTLGFGVFYNCSSLTTITIPDSIISIDYSAFRCCIGLTSIIIPNHVSIISDSLFYNCTRLKNVTIGRNVTAIENNVFDFCGNLEYFLFLGEYEPSYNSSIFSYCNKLAFVYVQPFYAQKLFCGKAIRYIAMPTDSFDFSQSNLFSNTIKFSDSKPFSFSLTNPISYSILPDYMSQTHTQTLSVTLYKTITKSETYKLSNIFISISSSNEQYTISESYTYERTIIPIYSYTILPTEYEFDIFIDTRPTPDNQTNIKLIVIICVSIGIPLIAIFVISLIYYTKKSRNKKEKFEYTKSEESENKISAIKNPNRNQLLNTLIEPTFY